MSEEVNGAFQVFESELDGWPLIAVIDKSYGTFNGKEKYPWFLSISAPLINANEKGLPNNQDAEALNQFEDNIESELNKACSFLFIGRVTCNGYRELVFYIDNPKKVADRLQSIIDSKKFRPFAFQCEKDNKWERVSVYLGK